MNFCATFFCNNNDPCHPRVNGLCEDQMQAEVEITWGK